MIRKAAARHVFCTCDLVNLLSSLRSLEERSGAPEPFVDLMIRVDSLLIPSESAFEARFPDSNLHQRTKNYNFQNQSKLILIMVHLQTCM